MIPERLRTLRREKNLSKRELVSMLPLNYSTYANYESGFREPNSEIIQMLAKHHEVSVDYLVGVSDNKRRAEDIAVLSEEEHEFIFMYRQLDKHGKEMVDFVMKKEFERANFINLRDSNKSFADDEWVVLPVYKQNTAAAASSYFEETSAYELMRFAPTPVSQVADFCVLINGDNMEPKIFDSDIAFIKSALKVEPDSVGIFIYEDVVHCKRLRVDNENGRIFLESINRSYAPKEITQPDELRTVGLVIGVAERKEII